MRLTIEEATKMMNENHGSLNLGGTSVTEYRIIYMYTEISISSKQQ